MKDAESSKHDKKKGKKYWIWNLKETTDWVDVSNKTTWATKKSYCQIINQWQNNGSRKNLVISNNRFSTIYIREPDKVEENSSERFTKNKILFPKSKNSFHKNKRPFQFINFQKETCHGTSLV